MNIKGQGNSLTLVKGTQSQQFQTSSLETAKPIDAKFNMEPPWDGGMKVCSKRPGHMTDMPAMPIYDKILKNIFFSGTKQPMTLKVGICSIGYSSTTNFVQMMTLG